MGSDRLFYTQDQAREIITYANKHKIHIIPEFDLPNHTTN